MTTAASTTQHETPETLAVACIGHLQQEEAMLTSTLEMLRRIRESLVTRDHDALSAALQEQERSQKSAFDLQLAREQIRVRISASLGVSPAEATLHQLALRVSGELQERLASGRRRLAELTNEIDAINRCNAVLVQQSMGLLNQVLYCLTGEEQTSQRYGASGHMATGSPGSVIQCEC